MSKPTPIPASQAKEDIFPVLSKTGPFTPDDKMILLEHIPRFYRAGEWYNEAEKVLHIIKKIIVGMDVSSEERSFVEEYAKGNVAVHYGDKKEDHCCGTNLLYDVYLTGILPANRARTILVINKQLDVGLPKARTMVDGVDSNPVLLAANMFISKATQFKAALEELGAKVILKNVG